MRRPIGEMNVEVIDAVASEKIREIESVTRTLFGLGTRTVFPLVSIDELTWPFACGFSVLFPNPQNCLRWCVMNRSTQARNLFITQTGKRRINGADLKVDTEAFQSQHLRIAKGLRNNGIPGIEIAEPHRNR